MLGARVDVKCPGCGTLIAARTDQAPSTKWLTCPQCHTPVPIVAPTDPPPLFSWEVYPHLYTPLPPVRVPRISLKRTALITLVAATVLLAGLAVVLIVEGSLALSPRQYALAGTVTADTGQGSVIAGARVVVDGENGFHRITLTDGSGRFAFSGVPSGAVSLNASARGFAWSNMTLFLSPVYQAVGNSSDLSVALVPGGPSEGNIFVFSPFLSLEEFVASVYSAGVILALGGLVAAGGAITLYRTDRPTLAAAGGIGTMLAPVAIALLGVELAFPTVSIVSVALIAVGGVAAVVVLGPMIQEGRVADRE